MKTLLTAILILITQISMAQYRTDGFAQGVRPYLGYASSSGGVKVESALYVVHSFTNSGNFVFSGNRKVDVLIVGGGGAGLAGGGGGGGVTQLVGYAITSGTYSVSVGSGGVSGNMYNNSGSSLAGSSSVFNVTAIRGGNGAYGAAPLAAAINGGSGGGGVYGNVGGTGLTGQGYAGGGSINSMPYACGGGGGAGQRGFDPPSGNKGGDGGCGVLCDFSAVDHLHGQAGQGAEDEG